MGNREISDTKKYIKEENLSFTRFLKPDAETFFRVSTSPSETFPRIVKHRKLVLFPVNVVVRGSGKISMKEIGSFKLMPGAVMVRRPGVEFDIERSPDYLEYSMTFAPFFYEYFRRSGFLRIESGVFYIDLDERILLEMAQMLELMRPDSSLSSQRLFLYIQDLLRNICFPPESEDEEESFKKNFERVTDISNDIPEMPEIARMMNIGYESFRKKFFDIYGLAPKKYFLIKRFQKAAADILSGLEIKEVAEKYGYNEVGAFAKQFKKLMGLPPGKYRYKNTERS